MPVLCQYYANVKCHLRPVVVLSEDCDIFKSICNLNEKMPNHAKNWLKGHKRSERHVMQPWQDTPVTQRQHDAGSLVPHCSPPCVQMKCRHDMIVMAWTFFIPTPCVPMKLPSCYAINLLIQSGGNRYLLWSFVCSVWKCEMLLKVNYSKV